MAKFSSDRFPPGFFDLPQSAGETLPRDIIAEWTRSAQTRDVARAILAPRTLRGIIVSSDAAGLTRITRERSLIDILAMLSHPKELIHSHGRAIGGRSIGVWAADNTQMFYDADIPAQHVVSMLLKVMRRIGAECEVGIGMCAHSGSFYELGGAIYGPDADRVEPVAEEHTDGGELVVSETVWNAIGDASAFTVIPRDDLTSSYGRMLSVTDGPALEDLVATDVNYPAPYSSGFGEDLSRYARTRRDSLVPQQAHEELAVVYIQREREDTDIPEVAVLNDLSLAAAMKRIGQALIDGVDGAEVKTSGLIGIYTFANCNTAIAFARAFRDALSAQRIDCRIGIDVGPVLVFELAPGSREIAGSPVNIASKLSEDVGEFGRIQMSDAVARSAGLKRERPTLTFNVAGLELRAYEV